MDAGPPIDEDLRCKECGGSLRGASLAGRCGGCGLEVMETFEAAARGEMGEQAEVVEKIRGGWLNRVARETAFSYEAVRFVAAVLPFLAGRGEANEVDAKRFCAGFAGQLMEVCGSAAAARRQLVGWGLTSSAEVGKIVFGLVKIGLVVPGEEEHALDFSNLFSLYTLFDGEKSV